MSDLLRLVSTPFGARLYLLHEEGIHGSLLHTGTILMMSVSLRYLRCDAVCLIIVWSMCYT